VFNFLFEAQLICLYLINTRHNAIRLSHVRLVLKCYTNTLGISKTGCKASFSMLCMSTFEIVLTQVCLPLNVPT